jgi:hypothetical protein
MQGKQDQRNFMGSVSIGEHLSLWFAVNCWLWTCPRGLLMVMFMHLDALSYPC